MEPMDVDRSSSSVSKMDISILDSSSDDFLFSDNKRSSVNLDSVTNKSSSSPGIEIQDFQNDEDDHAMISSQRISLETPQDSVMSKPNQRQKARSNIKTYHIKKDSYKKKAHISKCKLMLFSLPILCTGVILYQVINFDCMELLNLENVRESLSQNMFGQSLATSNIINALNQDSDTRILFLYGGTGVGKTYAVSLILENLWKSANIYHYTMPSFADTFSLELMLGVALCKNSIIVVDDLSRNDIHITKQIQDLIEKSKKLGKQMTIILVYNCDTVSDNFVKKCDFSFLMDLKESFESIDAVKHFIKFEQLTEKHLLKCVEKELGYRKVNEKHLETILKNFNVTLDGCKGVYKKMKFLNLV